MKIAILGAGKFGLRITEALLGGNYDITLIDNNEEKLNQLSQQYDVLTFAGDAREIDIFKQLNIKTYDFLLACTNSDDANIIAASCAKKLGCKKVVARVADPEHMNQLDFFCEHFNIDSIINPDMLITSEIYRYLIEKYSLSNGIYTNKRIALIEVEAKSNPEFRDLAVSDFRSVLPDSVIVGISRHGKVLIPHGNDVIQENDLLYLVGEKQAMLDYLHSKRSKHKITEKRKIMIIGGGRTGFYLAKRLSEYGAYVKLIESSKKRCHYLSSHLRNVMVLNGSGSDINLLEEENIEDMDAFVTATGFDEENLLLALTAKNYGVEDVISKISHESYDSLISQLNIDMVLNPMDISASAILRMISGAKRVLSTVLLQGQAELLEIYAEEGMGLVGVPLKRLALPEYTIIAAVNRGSQTIIPDGNTVIKPKDHVIVVCLLSHIGYIETLLKPNKKLNILK